MIRLSVVALLTVLVAACGGGGTSGVTPAPGTFPTPIPSSVPTAVPSSAPTAIPTSAPTTKPAGYVQTQFTFGTSAATTTQSLRGREFFPANNVKSATISLTAASAGGVSLPLQVAVDLSNCVTPCTVNGPLVPPGADTFDVAVYDGKLMGGAPTGNKLSEGSGTSTITAGIDNSVSITLQGIPASISIGALSPAQANAKSSQTLQIAVYDADNDRITGTYYNPVTVTLNNAGDPINGASLVLNGCAPSTCAASSITSTASTDSIALNYGGLALNATVSASALDANGRTVSASAPFSPALYDMAFSVGPNTVSTKKQEIDLFATSGFGASGSFSIAEDGFSNKPYNQSFSVAPSSPSACSKIATVSPASGTSFTVTVVGSPTSGSCTLNVSDGVHAAPLPVTVTYTKVSIGVQ